MKRAIVIFLVSILMIVFISTSTLLVIDIIKLEKEIQSTLNNSVSQELNEELYYNLFITLLYPHVEKAINDYYSNYMNYLPTEAPYSYNFLNIEKIYGKSYSFKVVLEVMPYVGPHLTVGVDHITFNIDLSEVTVEKFEHIESHELPPHYQNILKDNWPPK